MKNTSPESQTPVPVFQALDVPTRESVLDDFRLAREHIAMMLHLKLGAWQGLPYIFLGVGHHCEKTARELAALGLKQYEDSCLPQDEELENSTSEAAGVHHPLTLELCCQDKPLRGCLDAFIAGVSLHDLPLLLEFAAKARFTPVTERWVESLHASTHRSLRAAPHAGPLHIAFEAMLPRLKQSLQLDPSSLSAYGFTLFSDPEHPAGFGSSRLEESSHNLGCCPGIVWQTIPQKSLPLGCPCTHACRRSIHASFHSRRCCGEARSQKLAHAPHA